MFIDKSHVMKCWACEKLSKKEQDKCKFCKGTKKFKEDSYYLFYADKNGQKMCFGVDGLK